MSNGQNDDDLDELRQQRMEELKEQEGKQETQEGQEAAQQQAEAQKKAILRQHLTDDARQRLNTVKMSKPQFGEQVEQQVIAIARSGRLDGRIDDEKMRHLLQELKPDKKSFDIKRR
jgi:programmed cell death protein 5